MQKNQYWRRRFLWHE